MATIVRHPATLVWALLFTATCLSWYLGRHNCGHQALATIGIIAIALIKIRLIIRHFMEIRHAPLLWGWIFDAWIVIVGGAMMALYLIGG